MLEEKNTVFVGNIPHSTTDDELKGLFGQFGDITEVKIPVNRDTGQPRGFAFVRFATDEEAEKALSADGTELGGRRLRVNVAHGKKNDGPRRNNDGYRGGGGGGGWGRR